MNPITHALIGWTAAQRICTTRRDTAIVTLASIIPDFDGVGGVVDLITSGSRNPTTFYSDYHHVFGHNITADVIFSILAAIFSREKIKTGVFALLIYHLHLFCDIIGSKGPDGYQWPIDFFYPFYRGFELTWSGQWEVNANQNIATTVAFLFLAFKQARDLGFSPLWYFSEKADQAFVETIRTRFPIRK